MSMENELKSEFRFTGKHMLALMLTFFGIIVVVNFYMATMASKSWTGLVVKNSYVASQQYNGELERASEQKARGWHSDVGYGAGQLVLTLRDKDNKIIPFESVQAEVGRPAYEQQDRVIQFLPLSTGRNKIMLQLEKGLWSVRITGLADGQTYRRDIRMYVDGSGKGKLL